MDREIQALYAELLERLPHTVVGRGHGQVLRPLPVSADDDSAKNIVAVHWWEQGAAFDLAVVNLGPGPARCRVLPPRTERESGKFQISDLLDDRASTRLLDCTPGQGLLIELAAQGVALFHCRPS